MKIQKIAALFVALCMFGLVACGGGDVKKDTVPTETKPASQPAEKTPETKTETAPETKTETAPETKTETAPTTPEAKPETKPEAPAPE